jgi:hypothetical protein
MWFLFEMSDFFFFSASILHNSWPSPRCESAVKPVRKDIVVFMRKVVSLYYTLNRLELRSKVGSVMHFTLIYVGITLE